MKLLISWLDSYQFFCKGRAFFRKANLKAEKLRNL